MLAAPSSVSDDDTALRSIVEACGARLAVDDYGPQARHDASGVPFRRLLAGAVAPLPDHGLLVLSGEDRVRFLQSMTTNDIEHQPTSQARWHGLCTPKGRLLATMLAWRDEAAIRLLLPRALAEAVRKRLSMYVLRAKVRVEDRSDAQVVFGLCGASAAEALASLGLPAPGPFEIGRADTQAGTAGVETGSPGRAAPASVEALSARTEAGDATAATAVIGLPAIDDPAADAAAASGAPAAPLPRWLLVVPVASLSATWPRLAQRLLPIDSAAWRWTDVRSGIPRILPATVEQFVPQMIDFDTVGGVSFDKGCYPGQEIVARSHYLGKVKRRLFLGHLAGPEPAPGAGVFAAGAEPIGMVVLAAPAPGGGTDLLLEAQAAAVADAPHLRIDERPLHLGSLPYR